MNDYLHWSDPAIGAKRWHRPSEDPAAKEQRPFPRFRLPNRWDVDQHCVAFVKVLCSMFTWTSRFQDVSAGAPPTEWMNQSGERKAEYETDLRWWTGKINVMKRPGGSYEVISVWASQSVIELTAVVRVGPATHARYCLSDQGRVFLKWISPSLNLRASFRCVAWQGYFVSQWIQGWMKSSERKWQCSRLTAKNQYRGFGVTRLASQQLSKSTTYGTRRHLNVVSFSWRMLSSKRLSRYRE